MLDSTLTGLPPALNAAKPLMERPQVVALLSLFAHAAVLALTIVLVQFVDVAFRDPLRAAWLKRDGIVSGAAFGCVTILSLALALMTSGGLAAGVGLVAAIALTLAVALLTAVLSRRFVDIGRHLGPAEAARSPLEAITGTPGLQAVGAAAATEAPARDARAGA